MKQYIYILFLLLSWNSYLYSQTISYAINDTICCTNNGGEKFIDIDQDGIEDIKIAGTILTDVGYYFVEPLSNNIKVTSVTDKNESFENFGEEGQIAIGAIACIWGSPFVTGDPNKFIGIQKTIGADKFCSYIEVEFSEENPNDNSCWDSRVIVLQSVVNPTPNQELSAGETLTNIENIDLENEFKIFPNPTSDFIYFQSDFRGGSFYIFNLDGKEVRNGEIENGVLDISNLEDGVYFIGFENRGNSFYKRIVKL